MFQLLVTKFAKSTLFKSSAEYSNTLSWFILLDVVNNDVQMEFLQLAEYFIIHLTKEQASTMYKKYVLLQLWISFLICVFQVRLSTIRSIRKDIRLASFRTDTQGSRCKKTLNFSRIFQRELHFVFISFNLKNKINFNITIWSLSRKGE